MFKKKLGLNVLFNNLMHSNGRMDFSKKIIDEFYKEGVKSFSFEEKNHNKYLMKQLEFKSESLKIKKIFNEEVEKYSDYELEDMRHFQVEENKIKYFNSFEGHLKNQQELILSNLSSYHKKIKFDLFIIWNGYRLVDRVMMHFANKNNIKTLYLENGYFRPFTLMIDRKGVNYENSLSRDWNTYKDYQMIEMKLKAKKDEILQKKISKEKLNTKYKLLKVIDKINMLFNLYILKDYDTSLIKSLKIYSKRIKIRKINRKINGDINISDDMFIFVPFQVEGDSQIISQSPNIKKMKDLVNIVCYEVKKINNKSNKNLKVVFKSHPMDNYVDLFEISELIKNKYNDLASLVITGNTEKLIENSKMVITINSTVGIEALLKGKNVITLGNAFYNIEELVFHCKDIDKLDSSIEESLKKTKNKDNIKKYLSYLKNEYFFEIFFNNSSIQDIKRLKNFILEEIKNEN